MARVHCPDCEMAVVLDPNGVCPEGHLIGNAGRRIELAIGDQTPHPDEPQPWSAMVEAAEAIEQEPEAARQIRPISIAPDDNGDEDDSDNDSDNDMMMRELHALSDLDVVTEERAATGPTSPAPAEVADAASADVPEVYSAPVSAPAPQPSAEQPTTPQPAPAPRSDDDLEAIAELAALFDAPAGEPEPPQNQTSPDQPTPATSGSPDGDESLASVSHLPFTSGETAGATGATPAEGTDNLASGDSIDWSHFTARGKRRRFGR